MWRSHFSYLVSHISYHEHFITLPLWSAKFLSRIVNLQPQFTCKPGGPNEAYFRSTESAFRDSEPMSKSTIFGHETWPMAKVPEVAPTLSFYRKRSEMSLFSLYGQRFLRFLNLQYRISPRNVGIGKSSRSCTYTLVLPERVEIELIFPLRLIKIAQCLTLIRIVCWAN